MLTRCLTQSIRISSSSILLNRPSKAFLIARDHLKLSQMIKDRKLTTNQSFVRFNKDNKINNYERFKERLKTKTSNEIEQLKLFENELSQLGLVKKFKKIVSEYYHVIIVVHSITSTIWFGLMCLIKVHL